MQIIKVSASTKPSSKEDKNTYDHIFMACQTLSSVEPSIWLIDSGCTSHMTRHLSVFSQLDEFDQPKVKLGNGEVVQARGRGRIQVKTQKGTKFVSDVLYIPELSQKMLSVAQWLKKAILSFEKDFCITNDSEIYKTKMVENNFPIKLENLKEHAFSLSKSKNEPWHKRLGHFNFKTSKFMPDTEMVNDLPQISIQSQVCSSCATCKIYGKNHSQLLPLLGQLRLWN